MAFSDFLKSFTYPIFLTTQVPGGSSPDGCGVFAYFWIGLPSTKPFSGKRTKKGLTLLFLIPSQEIHLNSYENTLLFHDRYELYISNCFFCNNITHSFFLWGIKLSSTELLKISCQFVESIHIEYRCCYNSPLVITIEVNWESQEIETKEQTLRCMTSPILLS